ncbi:MAG: hypothetical protein IPH97_01560 [Ignavibacteriales bacterium]|nr:hypothetical protein [Ignavibacteriales bacterium]
MNKYKAPTNIIRFIDSLYNYMDKLELAKSINTSFRKDTLIVLKEEKYFEETYQGIFKNE